MTSQIHSLALVLCAGLLSCQGPIRKPQGSWTTGAPTPTLQELDRQDSDSASAEGAWNPQQGLEALLLRAATSSPTMVAATAAWEQSLAKVPQATALPNPWVSVGVYAAPVETRTGPMDGRIGITQAIPWPGKLETAGDRAQAQAEVQRRQLEALRLRMQQQFLGLWSERIYLEQEIAISQAQFALLEHIEEVSLRLYESSRATQADVLRAQVETLKMKDRVTQLILQQEPLVASMEALLGAPIADDATWSDRDLLNQETLRAAEELRQQLELHSPELHAIEAQILAAQEGVALADLEGMPNFSIGADWTWIGEGNPNLANAGDDALALNLAVEIPLQRGPVQGLRAEALASLRHARELQQHRRWQLLAELSTALSAHEDAWRRVHLYSQQLLPKAEQSYETTLAAYQSGQADFQDLLDAGRVMLDFRLSAARAQTDAALAYGDLRGLLPATQLLPMESQP